MMLSTIPNESSKNIEDLKRVVQLIGYSAANIVLEALAVEIMLKALCQKYNVCFGNTHDLLELFSQLPGDKQKIAEEYYATNLKEREKSSGVKLTSTLQELLQDSARIFTEWRYMYENCSASLHGRIGDMQSAFEALNKLQEAP